MQVSQLLMPEGSSPRRAEVNPAQEAVEADLVPDTSALHDDNNLPVSPITNEATFGSGLAALWTPLSCSEGRLLRADTASGSIAAIDKKPEDPGTGIHEFDIAMPSCSSPGLLGPEVAREPAGAPLSQASNDHLSSEHCLFRVGPYAVTRYIAAGGFAKVYEAVRQGSGWWVGVS